MRELYKLALSAGKQMPSDRLLRLTVEATPEAWLSCEVAGRKSNE